MLSNCRAVAAPRLYHRRVIMARALARWHSWCCSVIGSASDNREVASRIVVGQRILARHRGHRLTAALVVGDEVPLFNSAAADARVSAAYFEIFCTALRRF